MITTHGQTQSVDEAISDQASFITGSTDHRDLRAGIALDEQHQMAETRVDVWPPRGDLLDGAPHR
jgi:hypothetical protein